MNTIRRTSPIFGFLVFANLCHGEPKLTPSLDTELQGTNSIVYCPTLQIAWDGLQGMVNGPVEMERQDDLVQSLNASRCPEGVVPEEAHVAMAGYTDQDLVSRLEDALRKKFGEAAPELPPILSDKKTAMVTYSYLCRTLPFPKKFVRSTTIPLAFRSGREVHPVQFFGAPERTADDFESQVEILHYADENDFVVRLTSRVKDEFIVLAKMEPPDTMASGVEIVRKYLRAERKGITEIEVNGKKHFYTNTLSKGDLLAIPVVQLAVAADFPQLCDRQLKNRGFENAWLQQVYQDVHFAMDETGATVRSAAHVAAGFGGSSKPRRFLFDRPFLLTLWKKDAEQPYLAVWVASVDVLVPFKRDGRKEQQNGRGER